MKCLKCLMLFLSFGFLISAILISCSDKATNGQNNKNSLDYYLVSGPIAKGSPPAHYYDIYKTKSGEKVVERSLGNLIYTNLIFDKDGSIATFSGYQSGPPNGPYLTWAIDFTTQDTIARLPGILATDMALSPGEENLMMRSNTWLGLMRFPSLQTVFSESLTTVAAGFLTSGNRVFYLKPQVDSFFVVNFSTPDSISTTAFPRSISGLPLPLCTALVDYQSNSIFLLTTDNSTGFSKILAYDSDSLTLKQSFTVNRLYDGFSTHPDHNRLLLFANGLGGLEYNYLDFYNTKFNYVQAYLSGLDFFTRNPFFPKRIEFTPDGRDMFVLLIGSGAVVDLKIDDKTVSNYIASDTAHPQIIKIIEHR